MHNEDKLIYELLNNLIKHTTDPGKSIFAQYVMGKFMFGSEVIREVKKVCLELPSGVSLVVFKWPWIMQSPRLLG